MNVSTKGVALAAAFVEILVILTLLAPPLFGFLRTSLSWDIGLFPLIAFAIFFAAVFFRHDQLKSSSEMRIAALVAALCLAVENLPYIYGTIQYAVASRPPGYRWRDHAFTEVGYVFAPTVTVILLIAFLILTYRTRPGFEGLHSAATRGYGDTGLKSSALLAFIASLVALGQFFSALISTRGWHIAASPSQLALRLLSLISLAVFFLLFWMAQRSEVVPPES
jgi:hypothetical protein